MRSRVTIYTLVTDPNQKDQMGSGDIFVDSSDQLECVLVLPCSLTCDCTNAAIPPKNSRVTRNSDLEKQV